MDAPGGPIVCSFGGGRQSVGIVALCVIGELPWPDRFVFVDTGWENAMTFAYLDRYVDPALASVGRPSVERVRSADYRHAGIYDARGVLSLPVYTAGNGKLRNHCSTEWKRRVIDRYLRSVGVPSGVRWLGFGFEETRRWARCHRVYDRRWLTVCPLVDLAMSTAEVLLRIHSLGWPAPSHSSCSFCPNKTDREWLELRIKAPDQFEASCVLDEQLREEDLENGGRGVFLHQSRTPLRSVVFRESSETPSRCDGGGGCFT
jgi:hypothetical protein